MTPQRLRMTLKARALVAAIDTGLISETEEGYDISTFERFWDRFIELFENGSDPIHYPVTLRTRHACCNRHGSENPEHQKGQ